MSSCFILLLSTAPNPLTVLEAQCLSRSFKTKRHPPWHRNLSASPWQLPLRLSWFISPVPFTSHFTLFYCNRHFCRTRKKGERVLSIRKRTARTPWAPGLTSSFRGGPQICTLSPTPPEPANCPHPTPQQWGLNRYNYLMWVTQTRVLHI